jgi:PPP family 3-phenylpropionic acid transporter
MFGVGYGLGGFVGAFLAGATYMESTYFYLVLFLP